MKTLNSLILSAGLIFWLGGCGAETHDHDAGGTHTHADGSTHDDRAGHPVEPTEEDAHGHDEASLGTGLIGDMTVEFAQGHGAVRAGAEGHLVVKLPYSDAGATVVRAWIGTDDRTLSFVGRGEYAPTHDDYDVHAMAPDPLPPNSMWWIEVEKPDGTRVIGSAKPIME